MSAAVPLARVAVGVVVERRRATSPWIEHVWQPVAVLAGLPEAAPWTAIAVEADRAIFYAGSAEVELHRTETANYRDNLGSGAPALWVVLRPTGAEPPFAVVAVTADPAEGEAFSASGADLVESVPMPEPVREFVAAFVVEHHVERPFHKRQRDRADPEALGRRRRIAEEEG